MSDPTRQATEIDTDESERLLSDRYRLQDCLGEGGMGKVYRAEHVLMEKPVAIKVLHPDVGERDEIVARFRREAKAAAKLDHPNLCRALDFGRDEEGAFFFVMEFLEGPNLQDIIDDEGIIGERRALAIARQIADGLAEVHRHGIVHRDLKPDNVMIVNERDQSEVVKITDFGVAHLMASTLDDEDSPERLTRVGHVYGTPHYMAPEQVAAEDVDPRTDIYALGVVLFQMLTGSPPFDADNVARVMSKHVTQPIPALEDFNPELTAPDRLQLLIDKLMAKDRDRRPSSAEQVASSIASIEDHLGDPRDSRRLFAGPPNTTRAAAPRVDEDDESDASVTVATGPGDETKIAIDEADEVDEAFDESKPDVETSQDQPPPEDSTDQGLRLERPLLLTGSIAAILTLLTTACLVPVLFFGLPHLFGDEDAGTTDDGTPQTVAEAAEEATQTEEEDLQDSTDPPEPPADEDPTPLTEDETDPPTDDEVASADEAEEAEDTVAPQLEEDTDAVETETASARRASADEQPAPAEPEDTEQDATEVGATEQATDPPRRPRSRENTKGGGRGETKGGGRRNRR